MPIAIVKYFSAWLSGPNFVEISYSRKTLWSKYKLTWDFLVSFHPFFRRKNEKNKYSWELKIPVTYISH